MDDEPTPKVRIFDREQDARAVTKMTIEIYPSPEDSYIGHWYLDLPGEDDESEIDVNEIEALMDATFAAGYQLEKLIHMIESQAQEEDE
jgi:hypothetical protein